MSNPSSSMVQTVSGPIPSEDLGIALPHEHLVADISNYFIEPTDPTLRQRADEPVTLANLHWVRYNHLSNRDNLLLDDEALAVEEVSYFRDLGGRAIADVTPINTGRDPEALLRIADMTGVHILMGTGYYIEQSQAPGLLDRETDAAVAEIFINEITKGTVPSGIRAGIIGELGCSWPLTDKEKKVLRGAAFAQQETGASITIHPGHVPEAPIEIMTILSEAGADPTKVIIGHVELTIPHTDADSRFRLADTGCYLEFDQLGQSELQMYTYRSALPGVPYADIPNDGLSLTAVLQLLNKGFLEQVLLSMDVCLKTCLAAYGGPGYAHIQEVGVRMMADKGLTNDQIETITTRNPARALSLS